MLPAVQSGRGHVKAIRGGAGFGDALYVQSVARHLVQRGQRLEVCTAWPDVFRPIRSSVEFSAFRRQRIDVLAHYSARKSSPNTQFEDVCNTAGTPGAELRLDWTPTSSLGQTLRLGGPMVVVQMPRPPMGRTDGFGKELLPDCRKIQVAIDALRGKATIVQVGSGAALHKFEGIDVELSNKTSVCELIDVAQSADAFLGYVSFILPLAESFDKPVLLVWSTRGMKAAQTYVRQITPKKLLHKKTSHAVMDTASDQEIKEAADALL